MSLSTHVLDTARGVPADGISVTLFAVDGDARVALARTTTNADGRTDAPLAAELEPGMYEIVFGVAVYFARTATPTFFSDVAVRFTIAPDARHYHVPLLLSPWGYSTYRGS